IRFGLAAAGQTSRTLLRRTQTDLDDLSFLDGAEPAVVIRGKRVDGSATDDEETDSDEAATEPPVKSKAAKNAQADDASAGQSDDDSQSEESIEENAPAAKPGLGARLASALRIGKGSGDAERAAMMHQLEEAAKSSDETIDYEYPSTDLLLPGESVHLEEH